MKTEKQRMVKQMMATIFRVDFRRGLTSYNADPSLGVFGGEENVLKTLEDTKKPKGLYPFQQAGRQNCILGRQLQENWL